MHDDDWQRLFSGLGFTQSQFNQRQYKRAQEIVLKLTPLYIKKNIYNTALQQDAFAQYPI